MTHPEIKALVQKLIAASQIQPAIAVMRAYLLKAANGEPVFNDLLLVESRYSQNEQMYTVQRTIDLDDYQIESNSIKVALVALTDNFPPESAASLAEIEQLLLANNLTKKQVGKILYSIPSAMQVQVPVICTIRIAPEEVYESVLREGIDESNATHVEKLQRISEVMKVELREVGSGSFEIIPLTSELEQIIYPGEYTEWLYQVTPLQTGKRTLTLEVSVVEMLKEFGERRKSVKTLVRRIDVVTTEVDTDAVFEEGEQVDVAVSATPKPSPSQGPSVGAITGAIPARMDSSSVIGELDKMMDVSEPPLPPVTPGPKTATEATGTQTPTPQNRANASNIMMGVTAIAVLIVGGWFFLGNPSPSPGGDINAPGPFASNGKSEHSGLDTIHPTTDDTGKLQTAPINPNADPYARPMADSRDPKKDPDPYGNPTARPTHDDHTADIERNPTTHVGAGKTATPAKLTNQQVLGGIQQTVFSDPALAESFQKAPNKVFRIKYSFWINEKGEAAKYKAQGNEYPALTQACDRLIPRLKFTPETQNGKAVPSTLQLELSFKLTSPTAFTFVSAK